MDTGSDRALLDLIRHSALETAPRKAALVLIDHAGEQQRLSYGDLWAAIRRLSLTLRRAALDPGARVLVCASSPADFLPSFLSAIHADLVPVPTYALGSTWDLRDPSRLDNIIRNAGISAVISDGSFQTLEPTGSSQRENQYASLTVSFGQGDLPLVKSEKSLRADGLALIQYTSGSTAEPRGVAVSQANLSANIAAIRAALDMTAATVLVTWLPAYHDMGLIGCLLAPLACGATAVAMTPNTFAKAPWAWLQAISDYEADITVAPDFAYARTAQRSPIERSSTWSLGSLRIAVNGSEPVRETTMSAFSERFRDNGFNPSSFRPSYGLAEATLLVSFGHWTGSTGVDGESTGRFAPPDISGRAVSCGVPVGGAEVVITDQDSGCPVNDGQIGEILVCGPSVANGYFNSEEETAKKFGARVQGYGERSFLKTGDLGYLRDGELFVIGRLDNVLTFRGRQYSAEDLERSASGASDDLGACAVVTDNGSTVYMIAEVSDPGTCDPRVADRIRRAVMESTGLLIDHVLLVGRGHIPKTSSGKVRRRDCAQLVAARR